MSTDGQPSGGSEKTDSSPIETKHKRVLLIEDEPLTRLVLMNEFRMAGIDVDPAPSGRGALIKLRRGYPDAIFIGLPLRGIDGVQLIKEIRREPQYKKRPIFVCDSAFPGRARRHKALEAGATKVFDKLASPMHVILAEVTADLAAIESAQPSCSAEVQSETQSHPSKQTSGKIHESADLVSQSLHLLGECKDNEARAVECRKMYDLVHGLIKEVESAGIKGVERHTAVLESFLKQVCEKPNEINDAIHTISLAVEVLSLIADQHEPVQLTDFLAVVVDDDETSGHAICSALSQAGFRSSSFVKPAEAMAYLGSHRVDVVVLDIGLAAKNGSDLYTRIHDLPFNRETSIILITKPTSPEGFMQVLSTCDTQFLVKSQSATNYLEIALKGSSRGLKGRVTHRSAPPFTIEPAPTQDSNIPSLDPSVAASFEGLKPKEQAETTAKSDTVLRSTNEELLNQLEAVATEAAAQRDILTSKEEERKNLVERILQTEIELNRVRGELGEEHEKRRQLEQELQKLAATREAVQNQQSEQQLIRESSFQEQLKAAEEAAQKAELALKEHLRRNGNQSDDRLQTLRENLKKEQLERSKRFDEEVGRLNRKHDELHARFAAEQQGAEESRRRCEELQSRLQENTADLELVKATLKEREEDKARLEEELQAQLNATKTAADQAEAALQEKAAQCSRLEEELAVLRLEHQELRARLTVEHEKSEESRQKADELERRLRENAAELHRVRADLNKAGHSKQMEAELASLRRQHEEIQAQLTNEQRASAEARKITEEIENRLRGKSAELERIQVDREKNIAEKSRLESELRTRSESVQTVAEQIETAREEQAARLTELQSQLAQLQQVQEELTDKVTAGQQVATESGGRSEDLEEQLRQTAAELERTEAERTKRWEEETQADSDLIGNIEATQGEVGPAGEDLADLWVKCEELKTSLAAEKQLAAEALRGKQELEAQIAARNGDFERITKQLDEQASERLRLESELREQPGIVAAAAQQAADRCAALENELNTVRQAREQLASELENSQAAVANANRRVKELESQIAEMRLVSEALEQKLAAEKQVAAEAEQTKQKLETRLTEQMEEFERVKQGLIEQVADQTRSESESAAKAALKKAEKACREEVERRKQLESQLADLRSQWEEVNGQLAAEQRAAAETLRSRQELETRLEEQRGEVERRKQLESQLADLRSQWEEVNGQLATEQRAAAETLRARQELETRLEEQRGEVERRKQLESQLAELRSQCEEVNGRLATEQRTAAETSRARQELETRLEEQRGEIERRKQLESQLAELRSQCEQVNGRLAAEQRTAAETSRARQELETRLEEQRGEVERRKQLESQLAELRSECEQVNGRLAAEQRAAAGTSRARQELEARLDAQNREFENVKRELAEQAAQRAQLESALRQHPSTSGIAEAEKAYQRELEKSTRFEGELKKLWQTRDELRGQLSAEISRHLEIEKDIQSRIVDLERQLREREEALGQLTASLETERGARREADERASATAVELQDVYGKLATQLQVEKENQNRIGDLERQIREREEALARSNANVEAASLERQRAEERCSTLAVQLEKLDSELTLQLRVHKENEARVADLEHQRRECEQAITELHADLEKISADRQLADEQLQAAGNVIADLRQYAAAFEEAKQTFARTQEKLEARWQGTSDALDEREVKLKKETRERKRLAEALDAADRKVQTQCEAHAVELAKLQSALDMEAVERRRLEGEAANSRYALLGSVRAGRAFIDKLRTQNTELVGELVQRTRRLLELQLSDAQKEVAQSVLETGLTLQTTLQESAIPELSSTGNEGAGEPDLAQIIPLHAPTEEQPLRKIAS